MEEEKTEKTGSPICPRDTGPMCKNTAAKRLSTECRWTMVIHRLWKITVY